MSNLLSPNCWPRYYFDIKNSSLACFHFAHSTWSTNFPGFQFLINELICLGFKLFFFDVAVVSNIYQVIVSMTKGIKTSSPVCFRFAHSTWSTNSPCFQFLKDDLMCLCLKLFFFDVASVSHIYQVVISMTKN